MNKGILKVISGSLLAAIGLIGVVTGKNIKQRVVRIPILAASIVSIASGYYLVVDGIQDQALGVVGQYNISKSGYQSPTFRNKEEFLNTLKITQAANSDLRRIVFKCPDGSKSVTIYNNPIQPIGVPDDTITCDDGVVLIGYNK
jgi:hypothetical protein